MEHKNRYIVNGLDSFFRLQKKFSITSFPKFMKNKAISKLPRINTTGSETYFLVTFDGLKKASREIIKEYKLTLVPPPYKD